MSTVNVNIGHLCNQEFVFIQNGSSSGRLFKFCGVEEVVIYMQLRSPQFQRHIADWVAGTGQRCVALFAGGGGGVGGQKKKSRTENTKMVYQCCMEILTKHTFHFLTFQSNGNH